MRIGILSDIHSNLEALQVVLETMSHLKVDRYICLGDLVGYGASPNEVVDLIRPLVDYTIMGNHDAAVAGFMDYEYYYDSAREALDWTRETLTPENMEYLKGMPYFRLEGDAQFVHGEPMRPELFNYLYTLDHARNLHSHFNAIRKVTFVGHSHLRRVYELSETEVTELPVENLSFKQDKKYAIAIGSVGQPRDYDPRACFVIFDPDIMRTEFYRVEYDVDQAAEKILQAGLPEYFASRLYSGA